MLNLNTIMKSLVNCLLFVCLIGSINTYGQTQDSITFNATIGLTNNGISNVPNFSLNKPAITTYFSFTKGRLSFDPQIHVSTEFKPWQNSYWFHYKLADKPNFKLKAGLGLNFSYEYSSVIANGIRKSLITGNSYFMSELSADYIINKHLIISPFYMNGQGREKSGAGYLRFLSLATTIQNINVGNHLKAAVIPQIYHVLLDGLNGDFFSTSVALQTSQSPLSISAMMNTPIGHANTLPADFVWSASVHFNFGKTFYFNK